MVPSPNSDKVVLPHAIPEVRESDDEVASLEDGKLGSTSKLYQSTHATNNQIKKLAIAATVADAAVRFKRPIQKKHARRLYTLADGKIRALKDRSSHFIKKKPRGPVFTDVYHSMLKAGWTAFIAQVTVLWLAVGVIFAGFLRVPMGPHLCLTPQATHVDFASGALRVVVAEPSFLDTMFFSLQTLTVGPTQWSACSHWGNVFVVIEGFVGIFGIALLTGLVFVKFSKPTARMIFTHTCVVCDGKNTSDGFHTLSFRVANMRDSKIVNAKAAVHVYYNEVKPDGSKGRTFAQLPLQRDLNPEFTLTWTLTHVINESSPLYGMMANDIIERDVIVLALISGVEYTFSTTITGSTTFYPQDILFNSRHVDIYHGGKGKEEGHTVVNLHDFHDTESMS